MKNLLIILLLVTFLSGCDRRKNELNARFSEMISFIDQIKETEGFLETYSDPEIVQREKDSNQWSKIIKAAPPGILSIFRDRLIEAQSQTPVFSSKGDIATYTFENDFRMSFIKINDQWYIYTAKGKK